MEIKTFIDQLESRIKATGTGDDTTDLVRTGKMLRTISVALSELRKFVSTYRFADQEEEIDFFKTRKPVLLSQYYYHRKLVGLQVFDTFRDKRARIANYEKSLLQMQRYAARHRVFHEYCLAGATYLDHHYFTRAGSVVQCVEEDSTFTTGYDRMLARFLAHEMVRAYVQDALAVLRTEKSQPGNPDVQWTGSKVALIELIYALHSAGVMNHGNTEIKTIAETFEALFGIDLGNYPRVFADIKIRKTGRTSFLDQLRDRLARFAEEVG